MRGPKSLGKDSTHQVANVEDDLRGVGGQVTQRHGAVDGVANVTEHADCQTWSYAATRDQCCNSAPDMRRGRCFCLCGVQDPNLVVMRVSRHT